MLDDASEDRRAARRLVMDNLPVFLWIGFLQPVALAGWTRGWESLVAVLGGLVVGFAALIRPRWVAEDPRGNVGRTERWVRVVVHLVLFSVAAFYGLRYLEAVLRDIGWPERRMGYARQGPDSTLTFLVFVGFWALFLALLAERLAPWVRELLKIERHVLLGFAVALIGLRVLGRAPGVWVLEWNWSQAPGAMFGFGVAYAVVMGAAAGDWRGQIGARRVREWAGGLLWVGIPALVVLVVGLLGGEWAGSELVMVKKVGSEVGRFQAATVVLVPLDWWRALLDLTFCLGSIGICSYLGYLLTREIPLSFRWGRRLALGLVPVGVAWALLGAGAYGNVVRLVVTLACVVGPVAGGGRFALARGLAGIALGCLAWALLGPEPPIEVRADLAACVLPLVAALIGFTAGQTGRRGRRSASGT